jgi:hypothetical protein
MMTNATATELGFRAEALEAGMVKRALDGVRTYVIQPFSAQAGFVWTSEPEDLQLAGELQELEVMDLLFTALANDKVRAGIRALCIAFRPDEHKARLHALLANIVSSFIELFPGANVSDQRDGGGFSQLHLNLGQYKVQFAAVNALGHACGRMQGIQRALSGGNDGAKCTYLLILDGLRDMQRRLTSPVYVAPVAAVCSPCSHYTTAQIEGMIKSTMPTNPPRAANAANQPAAANQPRPANAANQPRPANQPLAANAANAHHAPGGIKASITINARRHAPGDIYEVITISDDSDGDLDP